MFLHSSHPLNSDLMHVAKKLKEARAMIYFYANDLSFITICLTYLSLLLPITIFYLAIITYCYPTQINKYGLITGFFSSILLNILFSMLLNQYYPYIVAINNTFNILTYFLTIVLFQQILHKRDHSFLIGLILITALAILTTSLFEYGRIYLLSVDDQPFFALPFINWYVLPFLVLLPIFRKITVSIKKKQFTAPYITLACLWFLLIVLFVFKLLIQVLSVSKTPKRFGHMIVVFLSNSFIGKKFVEQLLPSGKVIVNHIPNVYGIATLVLGICFLLILSFLTLILWNQQKKDALLRQKAVAYELIQYTKTLEELTIDIRKNHHDFSNILLSLGGYIYTAPVDLEKLKDYYATVSNTFELDYHYFSEISKLHNLNITELKTLIYSKLMAATKKQIAFTVEIDDPVDQLPIDALDLSRICGILIDNALEAANDCPEAAVRLAFITTPDTTVLMIVNTTIETHTEENLIQDGFSTKGADRGLGLSIVRQLIHKHADFLTFETRLQDSLVYQTLTFKKEE